MINCMPKNVRHFKSNVQAFQLTRKSLPHANRWSNFRQPFQPCKLHFWLLLLVHLRSSCWGIACLSDLILRIQWRARSKLALSLFLLINSEPTSAVFWGGCGMEPSARARHICLMEVANWDLPYHGRLWIQASCPAGPSWQSKAPAKQLATYSS